MSKRTILLLSLGGPRSQVEIPSFLEHLTGRRHSSVVVEEAIRRYMAIGGFSPLPGITEQLASLLASSFDTADETTVRAAFMHSHPTIEETVRECSCSQMAEIVFFALSPFYTTRTTGVYIKAGEDSLAGLSSPYSPATTFVHSWYAEQPFIDWWVKGVRKAVEQFHDAFFLFSAHSMPATGEDDLYRSQVEEAVRLIANQANLSSYGLAWQSTPQRTVEEWMAPSVEQTLGSLADQGKDSVVQIPVGFLVDNLETLYDIDIVHKRHAEGLGLRFHRLPCPNTDPLFVQALSNILSYCLKGFR